MPASEAKCSFCSKPGSKVQGLVSGPRGVFICNECVELCDEILNAEPDGQVVVRQARPAQSAVVIRALDAHRQQKTLKQQD
jgi:ATP-dependent Clp protease ATP-binding subunit ClpX